MRCRRCRVGRRSAAVARRLVPRLHGFGRQRTRGDAAALTDAEGPNVSNRNPPVTGTAEPPSLVDAQKLRAVVRACAVGFLGMPIAAQRYSRDVARAGACGAVSKTRCRPMWHASVR